ncbi:acetyl/propionyl/methylcrotonyl-CoA carboxylase subunit alpha [Variovorax terrae]|uniref:ATP-grasp domain-containing protein n=1 Tax=Variovorax terrae TaxID=2923278 RepID=A0A9X1VWM3_9BURK|nr:biotin carboxylase N-terminal domain-containing protein [Variovorax terrae]MCJ0761918.1 ATP-grasp domain-containing protein [Variovorax terrae]
MKRLLIANRGEIARRVIRTAHRMGIETVAVYSEPDAQALHVREATRAQALGGAASADSYLRIDKLLDAARASGADAVHPGYGFLSENADFAQAVLDAGLTWVGPPPAAIRALGSKSGAKALAQQHGVPCLPGYFGAAPSDERLAAEAARIGYPVMVKAVAGGGGRGMRLAAGPAQLAAALHGARSEAQSAFGSGELLLERALLAPRHVEVQVFADALGHCIHLGERDCSVQRRHQKLIEETPSPAVDADLRERMGRCAVALAQAAGYVGAGTVEFLLDQGEFFLMEMNTRLQVEHPVTEMVTGLDLVEWQLRIARGEPLPLAQDQVRFSGHAVEVRLCAEDESFTPHAGTVRRFRAPDGVRFDHALFEGLAVPPYYDSMLGKLIVHAATREEAIDRLAGALDRTELLGLPSNRALLAACLRHPVFRAGQALIPFLTQHGDVLREALQKREQEMTVRCGPSAIFTLKNASGVLPCPFARPLRLRHRGVLHDVPLQGLPERVPGLAAVGIERGRWHAQHEGVDFFIDDASFEPAVGAGGAAAARELRAPFNGKVIAVAAEPGATVRKGDTLLVIESMKLEHSLAAAQDATVKAVLVAPGQQAATSQVLVTFEAAA